MYLRPSTLREACEALVEAPAAILAGGTDFFPALADRPPPPRILDLSRIDGLDGLEIIDGVLRIGARVTWSRIARAPLPPCFDGLRAAAREVGSVQIQNVATLSGNLCNASPAADGVPPLLTLDASVELASSSGTRCLPLAAFLLGNRHTARRPDEILTAILVPVASPDATSCFLKLGARRYLVISIVMVAVLLEVAEGRVRSARIAIGACSAVATRMPELEAALIGASPAALGSLVRPHHLERLAPIADVRATADYRSEAALELVRRALRRCDGAAA
ncbi:FAD binding domain-containing protein [Enterovirga rhinocerotis]|uniref:CO/xanthine dehydrogenase FAD-binding subunit n=1 Tax=Enterovirga rhinocerotis TaxID=1339210 RepID=A0A4R7C7M5_9HYPH|nr:FAD binding domain-containing protein [Enterovirga rhinocerotis]TDR94408.1 CO/xanthine dehydrogenase FAD-binding subunit [Enterovirga rhinocerotis]